MLQAIGFKQGDVVADIGCGSGYYHLQDRGLVGEAGLVYAIDTNEKHIAYVSGLIDKFGIRNVRVPKPSRGITQLPEGSKVDIFFMCSLYHVLYASMEERELRRLGRRDPQPSQDRTASW